MIMIFLLFPLEIGFSYIVGLSFLWDFICCMCVLLIACFFYGVGCFNEYGGMKWWWCH